MGVKTPTLLYVGRVDARTSAMVVDPGDGTERHGRWHTSPHFGVVGASCDRCHVRNDDIGSAGHATDWLASHFCEVE